VGARRFFLSCTVSARRRNSSCTVGARKEKEEVPEEFGGLKIAESNVQ
jgi:hypothetical protein